MVKSTFFFTGQPVFANSASTSTGTKSSRSARNLAENVTGNLLTRGRICEWAAYLSGARWGMPTQKGGSRSLETTVSCRSTRTWTMATFVFHKDGMTHRARIVSYVETKTSRRGCKEQEVQLLTNNYGEAYT